uniref:Aldo/keto reductase n=1 Tax=Thermosporothrix sp. COM3 TaxID=2490863 RepID=A0A455SD63_9CHLR|nr:aldo/keto reductase [Thermosporothrix sp. COM3]
MNTVMKRTLGRSGLEVSAIGLGCWAIGGKFTLDGQPDGWGAVDDEESIRAIQRSLDLGVTLFDTADVYGCGHSERVLGRAVASRRHEVIIATKFGFLFDEATRQATGSNVSSEYIRSACEASLRRLGTDYIDLYQLHCGISSRAEGEEVITTLEELVHAGKIRFYGASTDDPELAALFAQGPHCTVIQQQRNVFDGNDEVLAFCEAQGLAALCRSPLAMGMLTGKYRSNAGLAEDDFRRRAPSWCAYFQADQIHRWAALVDALREVLTADGRTLVQGALAWIWARSSITIPIPGFKTVEQVEENVAALHYGPLPEDQMRQIDELLERAKEAR